MWAGRNGDIARVSPGIIVTNTLVMVWLTAPLFRLILSAPTSNWQRDFPLNETPPPAALISRWRRGGHLQHTAKHSRELLAPEVLEKCYCSRTEMESLLEAFVAPFSLFSPSLVLLSHAPPFFSACSCFFCFCFCFICDGEGFKCIEGPWVLL